MRLIHMWGLKSQIKSVLKSAMADKELMSAYEHHMLYLAKCKDKNSS